MIYVIHGNKITFIVIVIVIAWLTAIWLPAFNLAHVKLIVDDATISRNNHHSLREFTYPNYWFRMGCVDTVLCLQN